MDRRWFLTRATAVTLTGSLGGCTSVITDGGETYENPVFEPTMADPSILRYSAEDSDIFYVYGTEDNWYQESERHDTNSLQYMPIAKSRDLVEWKYVGEVFDSKPNWKESSGLWAPDIAAYDDQYYLYYSYSKWGDENPGIGVATATHPEGPFEDHGKLFDSEEIGVENSIDPYFIVDGGTPYLFWGSWYGIWGIELVENGLEVAGDPFRIGANDHFEAPWIIERNGYYYFFGSNGHCCNGKDSDYHVVVARAESLEGPYKNKNGDSIKEYPGSTILEGSDAFIGPGHNAIIRDDEGTDWIVYHAYRGDDFWINDTPRRALMIDPIRWEDGWPTIEEGTPSERAELPVIET